jgi:hypothetical protein
MRDYGLAIENLSEKDTVSSEDPKFAWAMSKLDDGVTRIAPLPACRLDVIHEEHRVRSLVYS